MANCGLRLSLRLSSLLVLLACSLPALAQYSSNIQGVVSDPAGAAINGASVQLRNTDTGVTAAIITSESGNYRFSSLPPGNYIVSAEAKGFRKTEATFALNTSETKGVNLALPVATAEQSITVEVHPPVVDTDDSRLEATLSSDTVRDLPSANRNLWDILAVTPGVVGVGTRLAGEAPGGLPDNFGTQTPQISANGRSYTGNVVMVDGMNVTSPVQNGNIILAPIPDAVQEASLQTNTWGGEDNLGSSILIQVTTKSGTNQFHGTGSLFFANQDLQATPDFVTGAAEPYARKDLVGALGGPIRKGKTFFFADFEKLWSTVPGATGQQLFEDPAFVQWAQTNYPSTVGTAVLAGWPATNLGGAFVSQDAGHYLVNPQAGCPTGQTAIQVTPSISLPCTLPMIDSGSFNASEYYNALQYNFRVDQYFTDRDRLYLSYYNDSFDQQQKSPRPRLNALDIMRNRYAQIDFTHTFNSSLLWESSFAFASVGGANGQDANLAVPNVSVAGNLTGWPVGGGWGPGEYRGPMYNWRSVLSWVHGKHTVKFGYDGARGIEHGDFTPDNVRPGFTFNNLLDLVQDNVFQESVGAYNPLTGLAGSVVYGGMENPFGFFGQDDWKVRSNLSLTVSMRWDDFTNHIPWGNSGFQFSALNLGSAGTFNEQVQYATVGVVPAVFANSMKNIFSPRIGFAWDPTKKGQWAVRGGVGVYHDWIAMGQTIDQTRNNPPGVLSETFTDVAPTVNGVPGQPLGNYFAIAPSGSYPWGFVLPPIPAGSLNAAGGIAGVPTNVDSLDRNMKAPLAVNYVIGVERQLPGNLVAGANYSGSRSYNGLTGADVNRLPGDASFSGCVPGPSFPSCKGIAEAINRPNTNFGAITYVNNANQATYNAMILSLRGKAGHRGSFQGSYTLSHAKDYPEANTRFDQDGQDGGANIPDQNAYFGYYGDANYDVRQRFSFSGLYNLPGLKHGIGKVLTDGWELSSIIAVQTGTPFWAIDNRPLDVMCASGGTGGAPIPCDTPNLPAGTTPITPNILAPGSGDYNMDGLGYDVPLAAAQNFTGGHSRSAYLKGLFTAADFGQPTQGTEGTEPRNIYRNPGMFQADASVLKNNHLPWLGEQGNLQFRFDFLNVFNHGNLGTVDPNMADGTFGKVTSTLNPFDARKIELGLRVSF
ncbi:MAG: carboxypeptidase regulatory-like domain-containing protein [Candidatus Sulfotelmatobacter sp.]